MLFYLKIIMPIRICTCSFFAQKERKVQNEGHGASVTMVLSDLSAVRNLTPEVVKLNEDKIVLSSNSSIRSTEYYVFVIFD